MILALLSYWRQPIEISRSTDRRQVGLLLPIGVMIRDPAGGGGGDASTLNGQDGAYYLSRVNHTGTQDASTIAGLATVATSGSYNDLSNKPTISTDAQTLNGQNGAYYLDRSNHTGTQAISTIDNLQDALDLKLDAADYNDRFLGLYASFFDLVAAHPTASSGDYAQVDLGIGSDVIVYTWDVSDNQWAAVGSSAIANTDALPEGSSNLYFTTQRVRDATLTGFSPTNSAIISTDNVVQAFGKAQGQIDELINTTDVSKSLFAISASNKIITSNIASATYSADKITFNADLSLSLALYDTYAIEIDLILDFPSAQPNAVGIMPFINQAVILLSAEMQMAVNAINFVSVYKIRLDLTRVSNNRISVSGYGHSLNGAIVTFTHVSVVSSNTFMFNVAARFTGTPQGQNKIIVKSARMYKLTKPV